MNSPRTIKEIPEPIKKFALNAFDAIKELRQKTKGGDPITVGVDYENTKYFFQEPFGDQDKYWIHTEETSIPVRVCFGSSKDTKERFLRDYDAPVHRLILVK